MPNTVIYHIQKGDTLSDIAQKLGINDWHKLRDFHNTHGSYKVTERIYAGKTLTTPNKAEVAKMNGTSKENTSTDTKPKEKKPEKKKEKKEKQEGAKSEHSGKYFVVHNATCVCNKAENPSQTAKLQVTTHKLVIFNNQQGKFAATEEDKQFNPPAATFGKCTLKPSSGGNLPCQVAPAPKWAKSYNKTKVLGKNILTEISTLQCTIGGKISVKNHGQSNTVTKEHSDNTNKAELAMVNPGVTIPANKKQFPAASSITLKQIENRTSFIPITSSKEEKSPILLRKNELCNFTAKLSEGNSALISWLVYDGLTGDVSKKILLSEQIGVNFKNAFPKIGSYRVEGFGKPKTDEFEGGKYNKNYIDCSLDFEVIVNKLSGTELNASGAFQKGVPITFETPFLIEPNFEELQRLLIYAIDGGGNLILDGGNQVGNKYTFTPKNSGAKYTILAEYKDDEGKTQVLKVSGETLKATNPIIPSVPSPVPSTPSKPNIPSIPPSPSVPSAPPVEQNVVLSISHSDEVVRPETPLTFTAKTRNANKLDQIKWNLNGKQIGTGITINVPPVLIMQPGKYVIEAYIVSANAYGPEAKKEQDDWHFEVKKNDVVSFSTSSGTFKLGKKLTLTADKFIFKNLVPGEQIAWQVQGGESFSNVKSIEITPKTLGYLNVTSKINNNPGVTMGLDVRQAQVASMNFTNDFNTEVQKASWGQKINISIGEEFLKDENIEVIVSDSKNNLLKTIKINKYSGDLIPLTLDNDIKSKTDQNTSFNLKIKCLDLDLMGKDEIFPTRYKLAVSDGKEIYKAIFSSDESGKTRIYNVNYNTISFFYGSTIGIKKTDKLILQIYNNDPNSAEPLLTYSGISVDDSGALKQRINWGDIKDKIPQQKLYAVVRDNESKGVVLYNSKGDVSKAVLTIIKVSELPKRPENTTPAKVDPPPVPKGKEGVCECEAKVRAFMRMIRVGEGTPTRKGYGMIFGGEYFTDFSKHPEKVVRKTNSKGKVYYSSAAGAYQMMDFKWWEINGFELTEKTLKKTGKYFESRNLAKKYNITDFTPESQDKLCIVIFKHTHPGIIDLIRKDRITQAINKSKGTWASLPGSEHGQPTQGLNSAIAKYKGYLAEELAGNSELYIKKGFLKEFGYDCCSGKTEAPAPAPTPVSTGDSDIEFHIQNSSGEIQYKINNEKRETASYIYYDNSGKSHKIGKYNLKKVNDQYKQNIYLDPINKKSIYLFNMNQILGKQFSSGDLKFKIRKNTVRMYLNDVTMAALFGAMLDCGYTDFSFNGGSGSSGETNAPSVSHKNGMHADLNYLRKDKSGSALDISGNGWKALDEERQNKFNDALYKYGWTDMLSWAFNGRTLNHARHFKNHNHHLHTQIFKPKFKKI
jgi:muramidase (phage lysozyme)